MNGSRRIALACTTALTWAVTCLAWGAGLKIGVTACLPGRLSPQQASTACGALTGAGLPWWQGLPMAALCLATAALAAGLARNRRLLVVPARLVAAAWVLAAFPMHLPFEVLGGLSGMATEWRSLAERTAWLVVGTTLALATVPPRCGHSRPIRRLAPWARIAVRVAAAIPLVGWTIPHLAWLTGTPLGIPPTTLSQARGITPALGAFITLLPVGTAVLTLGLDRPWGQRWPSWVPLVGGRSVPRALPVAAGGIAGLALMVYGVIGLVLMSRDLARGTTSWGALASSWAVAVTEVVFLAWGLALLLAVTGYAQATRCPACSAQRQSGSAPVAAVGHPGRDQ